MLLALERVSKAFGGIRAVNSVSLKIEAGRITALVGPNGAGKTTLFNLITGFLQLDEGEVYFRNARITRLQPFEVANLGLGRMFQDVRLFEKMTVLDNLMVAPRRQRGERLTGLLLHPRQMRREERANRDHALGWLEYVGLRSFASELAERLSYGQQKLVALARCLAAEPDLLLLDEPVSGLDPVHRLQVLALMRGIAERGKTVCIIEHNMDTVRELADWVIMLLQGKVVAEGPPQVLMADQGLQDLYFGIRGYAEWCSSR